MEQFLLYLCKMTPIMCKKIIFEVNIYSTYMEFKDWKFFIPSINLKKIIFGQFENISRLKNIFCFHHTKKNIAWQFFQYLRLPKIPTINSNFDLNGSGTYWSRKPELYWEVCWRSLKSIIFLHKSFFGKNSKSINILYPIQFGKIPDKHLFHK